MIKRFFLALAFAGLLSPVYGAGTIPFSLSQQFDSLGKPLAGCKLYTIQAGTVSTPQNAYQDSALTIALPNPQTCDAAGRLSQMFLADGQIKVRLTDRNLVTIVVADNIQVIGNSSGGGGGGTVDPTTILATGDIKSAYGTAVLSGFVRANGRTIGSATSGATERANADTQTLFVYLYGADPNLAVSGGRGASAAADFAANKTIALPDFRGRVLAGFDDMGNSLAGRLNLSSMTGTGIGSFGGNQVQNLSTANLPPYTPTGTLSLSTPVSTSVTTTGTTTVTSNTNVVKTGTVNIIDFPSTAGSGLRAPDNTASAGISTSTGSISASSTATSTATPTGTFTGAAQGGTSAVFVNIQPTTVVTMYIKL